MKNLYKALASFQQEVPVIHKGTPGHNYSYADLPAIFEVINPLLKKHGLGFYQAIDGTALRTVVFDVNSGESIQSVTTLPIESLQYQSVTITDSKGITKQKNILPGFEAMNVAQATGSLYTYFRRYALSSLLGLVTDKDTDGTGSDDIKTNFKI